jgi:hypothetical protein
MANFFEKLKRGMGIEIPVEEEKKKEGIKEKKEVEVREKERKREVQLKEKEVKKEEKWPEPEGELAVDMYQTDEELVILSAIAGAKPEDLNLYLEGDG